MTVIAAACAGGRVWMASDSELIDGVGRPWPDAHKIISVLQDGAQVALLGHTGMAKAGHRVRRQLAVEGLPPETGHLGDDDWADHFSGLVDAWLRADPPLDKDDEHLDSEWLLARTGRLWRVRPGYATPVGDYTAMGSGGDLALGVLFGRLEGRNEIQPDAARDAVAAGVRAALRFDESCRGEVVLHELTATDGGNNHS